MSASIPALENLDVVSAGGREHLSAFSSRAKLLGRGGAGSVYAHPALPGQAVKIYATEDRAQAHAAKVQAMLSATPRAVRTALGTVQIAWPNATVQRRGRFVGFVMPQINFAEAWTLQQVTQPTQRRRRGIPERLDLRVYAGRNLASVLHSLHEQGHYVIDLKPQNVLVYRDDAGRNAATVALVDCDGFQVRDRGGQRYDAELATAQFLHPDVARTVGGEASFDARQLNDKAALQDGFALAIILFQLLNDALHPMAGQETGQMPVPSELALRLQAGGRFYPYGLGKPNPALLPDQDSLHEWFDPELRRLFDQAFCGGQAPPKPGEWVSALARLCDDSHRCPRNDDHWRLGPVCGQCALAQRRLHSAPALAQVPLPPRPVARPSATLAQPRPSFRPAPNRQPAAAWTTPRPAPKRRRTALVLGGLAAAWLGLHNHSIAIRPGGGILAQREWGSTVAFPLRTRAVLFVNDYFRSWSSSEPAFALDWRHYALEVNYYGKPTSAAAVIASKQAFIKRWPSRSYVVRPGSRTVDCRGDTCVVSGLVDWSDRNEAHNARSAGTANFTFTLTLSIGQLLITRENGSVIKKAE